MPDIMNKPLPLVDQFSRTISYLRLSLTDRCNLRCMYCMPQEDESKDSELKTGKFFPQIELLTYEELLRIVELAVGMGMNKLRLTGGEPLVRKGVIGFIHQLSALKGLDEIRLTTNGVLLAKYGKQLAAEGVKHINVSLDTLVPEKFHKITGKDLFKGVWHGLMTAMDMGFNVKINVVAMKGVNDNEFRDFANLALDYPFQVRFIEFMPVGDKSSWQREQFISADEIQSMFSAMGKLTPFSRRNVDGPARVFELESADGRKGSVGFISPISHHFCDQCNRLRLTSEGKLRACLLNDQESDLKGLLRSGAGDKEIISIIRQTILDKPQGHSLQSTLEGEERTTCGGRMSRIGG